MASLTRRAPLSAERGNALIEFAIVLPLMLLILFGMIDFGLLFQRYQVVTNAAHEGARIAVLPGYDDDDVVLRVTQFMVAAGLTDPPPPTLVRGCEALGAKWIDVVSVTVEYPYSYSAIGEFVTYFGEASFSRNSVKATALMRSELAADDEMCAGS